jgi:hypothetical protein
MTDPTLPQAMQLIADAINGLAAAGGFTVRAQPHQSAGPDRRAGDAWVTPPRVTPATFGLARAELETVIVLSADPTRASGLFAELAVPVLDAVTQIDELPVADVEVTPQSLLAGDAATGALYLLVVNATAEVS